MKNRGILDTFHRVIDLLEGDRTPYMVMGGFAVRVWGIPRPTYDLDLTISVSPEEIKSLCLRAEEQGFTVPEIHKTGFVDTLKGMSKISFQVYAPGQTISIDIFIATTVYQNTAFGRRQRENIDGRSVWVISVEDLILHKLIAGRDRDMADISDILLIQGKVDLEYLRRWATPLGVSDKLEQKLAER